MKSTNRRTLLVVEDQRPTGMFIHQVLRAADYDTVPASSGVVALADFERHALDLVMIDLGLQDMDPIELMRRMRANAPDLPVLFTTTGNIRLPRSVSTDTHTRLLNEPYDAPRLLEIVKEMMQEQH